MYPGFNMNRESLLGSKVSLFISDPWEFGTECGTGPFHGSIVDMDDGRIMVLLDKTILYEGYNYVICICSSRFQGKDIKDIFNKVKIPANMMLISANVRSFNDLKQQLQYQTQAAIGSIEQLA